MPISFPANPALNQVYVFGGRAWTYNGKGWFPAAGTAANLLAVSSSVVPTANVTYDLGANAARWRDLYLAGNTIDLGGTAIKTTANGVTFTSAANADVNIPLTVSSVRLKTSGNVITLTAGALGLQTISGNTVVPVGGATVTVANTIPATTTEGSLWLDNETGKLRIYYGGAWAGVAVGPVGATGLTGATGPAGSGGVANVYNVAANTTGYFGLPSGTTLERPASPVNGAARLNTTTGFFEVYYSGSWYNMGSFGGFAATGGTVTTVGGYKIHTFYETGTFNVVFAPPNSTIQVLLVAGGGGASTRHQGGGGGGGCHFSGPGGTGGTGGGGAGTQSALTATAGTANTGGGGGGGGHTSGAGNQGFGGAGGSGIVIIKINQ